MQLVLSALWQTIDRTWRNFLVFAVASAILSSIAVTVGWLFEQFSSGCSTIQYSIDHILALIDANALTAFATVFILSLSGRILFHWWVTDAAFEIATRLLTDAFAAVCGVMIGVGAVLALGGSFANFYVALQLTSLAFILAAIGNGFRLHERKPLAGWFRGIFGLATLLLAVILPPLAASQFKSNKKEETPQSRCQPLQRAPDTVTNPARPG